jgi:flagellar motor protein MotB
MRKRRGPSSLDKIHERALKLGEALRSARDKGNITPGKPMTGRVLAKELNKHFNWDLSADAGVRELVNHARTIGIPIAGDGRGYFFARDSAELSPAIADLKSRIAKISQALHGLEKSARQMGQIESELFRNTG